VSGGVDGREGSVRGGAVESDDEADDETDDETILQSLLDGVLGFTIVLSVVFVALAFPLFRRRMGAPLALFVIVFCLTLI